MLEHSGYFHHHEVEKFVATEANWQSKKLAGHRMVMFLPVVASLPCPEYLQMYGVELGRDLGQLQQVDVELVELSVAGLHEGFYMMASALVCRLSQTGEERWQDEAELELGRSQA